MIHVVVIKAIRACNLRCSYCYYINEDTPNYGMIISTETLKRLYAHLATYLAGRTDFAFVWHGGEPLLLGKRRFQAFLDLQADYFAPGQVRNVLQTNGVLVDQAWIDFFQRNQIFAGVSLDGTRDNHDQYRKTIKGRGTYDEVLNAVRLFQENGLHIGVISVVHDGLDGAASLRHFQDLGVAVADYLIPMTNNALQESDLAGDYGTFTDFATIGSALTDAFQAWVKYPEPAIKVRLFEGLIQNAFGLEHGYLNAGSFDLSENLILETNGDVCLDTDFWHIDRFALGDQYHLQTNVHDPDFSFAAAEASLHAFVRAHHLDQLPDDCQRCKVRSICHASHPASRFGADGTFNHRSAYCEAMYMLSDAVLDYVADAGYTASLYDADLRRAMTDQGETRVLSKAAS
ncbi:MAG: radical SAM protein [Chloroflexia bacterium]|nr:radical SAM protein [Chloroflexia bacterium]